MCKMFFNFFMFIVTASVLAGNLSAESDANVHGSAPAPLNSTELKNQTSSANLGSATVKNIRKEENISTNQPNVGQNNDNTTKSTIDNNIALDNNKNANNSIVETTITNNASKTTVDNNSALDYNKTKNNNNVDQKAANNGDKSTLDNKIVVDHNKTANVNVMDNKTVNKTTENKQNTTLDSHSNKSNVTKNGTEKHTIEPKGASKTEDSNIDGGKPTVPSTPINNNSTKGNVSVSNVHGNESAKINLGASTKANVTAASIQPVSTSSGDPKWKAILITATVVIVGCCGVILVQRSLKSERGQAWLERTRRQANVPYRDYEVQYLVIRDNDD